VGATQCARAHETKRKRKGSRPDSALDPGAVGGRTTVTQRDENRPGNTRADPYSGKGPLKIARSRLPVEIV